MGLSGGEGENYRSVMKRQTGLDLTAVAGIDQLCLNCAFAISMTGHPSDAALNAHFPRAVRRNRRSATGDYKRVRRDLSLLVDRGVLPAQIPLFNEDSERKDSEIRHWTLLPDEAPTPYHSQQDDCGRIAVGTPSDDAMWCNAHQGHDAATTWIIAGKGHDVIGVDDDLSQVLSGGRGDDIIGAGFGNDVIYFGRAWGDDLVSMRCLSRWDDSPLPAYQDSRYVVFGRGVRPKNLRWLNDREIEDVSTGSRIRFADELCRARFIAVEPGSIPERPDSEPGS
jgi:hypothetical protein